MDDLIFLLLSIIVFIPLLLINFQGVQKIQKTQKEIILLLQELNKSLTERNGK